MLKNKANEKNVKCFYKCVFNLYMPIKVLFFVQSSGISSIASCQITFGWNDGRDVPYYLLRFVVFNISVWFLEITFVSDFSFANQEKHEKKNRWLDDDVCRSFQKKVIWHEAILDIFCPHPNTFISIRTLKTHLKNLKHHPISDIP